MKKTLATFTATSMLALGGAVAIAAPAHADPINCNASVGGTPGNVTFTLNIKANPCRYPMRAWDECTMEDIGLGLGNWTATSGTTQAYSGEAVANCSPGIVDTYFWGYDMYYSGGWHRYNMETDTWES